ncbi:MAG: c-type cytochrome biogenesis protein CcmI [Betaproteobacteria bacterium]|nr:c-type cytochrome biogenesis protein CcmI [Betaproteobacteria bacterium]
MIAFAGAAVFLLVAAVVIVLWPLLKRSNSPVVGRHLSNLDIHRDQFSELDKDLEAGMLGADRYEQAKNELERRVLEEAAAPAEPPQSATQGKAVAIVIGVFLPLAAILLYLYLGNLQGLVAPRHPAADLSSITADQFQDMTVKLAARMQQNPGDAEGWKMLGRAYRAMERFGEANDAYKKAVDLRSQDPDLLADYAESLALAAGRSLIGEPTRLLDRAFRLDPHSTKVLALSGSAAFERKDYKAAIRYWETIIKQPGVSTELAQALQKGVAESKARLTGKPVAAALAGKERVTGVVALADSLRDRARPDDTVFVFARAASGPRMPLAIVKIKVADLPYQFLFDDSMAMMPEMKLSQFAEIVIDARVSKSGGATPSAGDLEGASDKIKPGRNGIRVTIDRAVAKP